MEPILYFFRDTISGIDYIIYAFITLFFMFSIIGYLFKQKYAKVEIKLNSSQTGLKKENINTTNSQEQVKMSRKEKKLFKKQKKTSEEKTQINAKVESAITTNPTNTMNTQTNQVSNQPLPNVNNQPINQQSQQIQSSTNNGVIPEIK